MGQYTQALKTVRSIVLDACSKTGVPILYPNPRRGVFPLDPNFRIKTGSITERLFCGLLAIALIFTCYLNLNGGILTGFSNWLGSAPGAVDIYYQYADQKEIYATISGTHRITQEAFDKKRFRVLAAATETDLIVSDKLYKYRIGASQEAQIRPTKIVLDFGKEIAIETQSIAIEEPRSLSSLTNVLGNSSYATGQLETDEGDSLVSTSDPRYFSAASVQHIGSGRALIILKAATRSDLQSLGDISVSGSVVVRVVK